MHEKTSSKILTVIANRSLNTEISGFKNHQYTRKLYYERNFKTKMYRHDLIVD